jgi:hypothetical protein
VLDYTLDVLRDGRAHQVRLLRDEEPLPYLRAIEMWQHSSTFRSFFLSLLADAPFDAFRWETPPITTTAANRPFEFVLLDSPGLARPPDPAPFARHFPATDPVDASGAWDSIAVFDNLGGDAVLVVPAPRGPVSAYGHLAAFTRQASADQNHALWRAVGAVLQRQIGTEPVWLSTAGGGVSWLHVRLDTRPKYYGFRPYAAYP